MSILDENKNCPNDLRSRFPNEVDAQFGSVAVEVKSGFVNDNKKQEIIENGGCEYCNEEFSKTGNNST